MEIKELKDTVEPMLSNNYKERLKAEYYQVKIRFTDLKDALENAVFTVEQKDLLQSQAEYMFNYLNVLERRAKLEQIEL